ncbi:MAG TPA: metallopeptidase family protein [Terrimicrobiaceae bacterium]
MLSKIAQEEVHAALQSLPPEIRTQVRRVPVFLECRPDAEDIAQGVEPDTLGLYEEGVPEAPAPRIRLWLKNLWDFAEDDAAVFRAEVRTTLFHEIGHLLGWDEQDVQERGLG